MRLLYADYNGDKSTAKTWKTSQGSYGTTETGKYVWNKEHIWAKANGFGKSESCPAYSDLHHLRASDWKCNNTRSDYAFNNVANHTSSNASYDWTQSRRTDNYCANSTFEPRDSDKGDVARALFYMATRYYNGDGSSGTNLTLTTGTDASNGKWGYLDTLLAWHEADPVDEFEAHRNDLIYEQFQHNRNPYIDHPEYARAVFKDEPIVDPDTLTNLTYTGTPSKTSYKEGESFNSNGLTVTATFKKNDNTTYTSNVTSEIVWTPNPLVKSTTSVTGTYTYGDVTKTIQVNGISVSSLDGIRLSGNPTKSIYDEGDSFNPAGITVYASYGSEEVDVSSTASWDSVPLEKGQTSVNVTYGNQQATYTGILVKEKSLSTKTIEFADSSKDSSSSINTTAINSKMTSGSDIATVNSASNIYEGKTGLKFASGKSGGSLTIALKASTQVTKLVVSALLYSSDSTTVTVATSASTSSTFKPGSTLGNYEIAVGASITTITISSPSGQRFYFKSVDIFSGSSSDTSSLTEWGISYLHIDDSSFDGPGTGLCKSNDLYKYAKVALFNIAAVESSTISDLQNNSAYSAEYARYMAWARACQDDTPLVNDYTFLSRAFYRDNYLESNNSTMLIIIVVSSISILAFTTLLIIKKRKHK